MAISLTKRILRAAGVSVALLPALLAMPVNAAPAHGEFNEGLYTAPGQLFTVKSPLGPRPILVDRFERSTGAVTFIGDGGQLFGVICTPNLDVLADAAIDTEMATAILRNWLRDSVFPAFFVGSMPGASIVRDEPGEFEGQPAWIAMLHLPGGSPFIQPDPVTGEVTRGDSWRGAVVISRDGETYMLMTEAIPEATGPGNQAFDASAPDWNSFLPKLTQFYRGMTFLAGNAASDDSSAATGASTAGP